MASYVVPGGWGTTDSSVLAYPQEDSPPTKKTFKSLDYILAMANELKTTYDNQFLTLPIPAPIPYVPGYKPKSKPLKFTYDPHTYTFTIFQGTFNGH